jgi:hypothetical protein
VDPCLILARSNRLRCRRVLKEETRIKNERFLPVFLPVTPVTGFTSKTDVTDLPTSFPLRLSAWPVHYASPAASAQARATNDDDFPSTSSGRWQQAGRTAWPSAVSTTRDCFLHAHHFIEPSVSKQLAYNYSFIAITACWREVTNYRNAKKFPAS